MLQFVCLSTASIVALLFFFGVGSGKTAVSCLML